MNNIYENNTELSLKAGLLTLLFAILTYGSVSFGDLMFKKLFPTESYYLLLQMIIYSIINWLSFYFNILIKLIKKEKLKLILNCFVPLLVVFISFEVICRLFVGSSYFGNLYKLSVKIPFSFLLPIVLMIAYTIIVFTLFQNKAKIKKSFWIIMITTLISAVISGFYLGFSSESFFELIIAEILFLLFLIINYNLKIKVFEGQT